MRPVNKGTAPNIYKEYGEARHDLAYRIGYYCSYCEMKVFNSIEVEHILPQNQGGNVVDWDNFLLSCKYCNTIKSDRNASLIGYFWPDRDNTDLVFDYDEVNVVAGKARLSKSLIVYANNTIDLAGLGRRPGSTKSPTKADTRWRSRKENWDKARKSLSNWKLASIPPMAKQIGITALGGHYSIWCEVFKTEQIVLDEIDTAYRTKGLFKEFEIDGSRKIRPQGLI